MDLLHSIESEKPRWLISKITRFTAVGRPITKGLPIFKSSQNVEVSKQGQACRFGFGTINSLEVPKILTLSRSPPVEGMASSSDGAAPAYKKVLGIVFEEIGRSTYVCGDDSGGS